MKKLKLKDLSAIGNVLTSEELKHVYGGNKGGSGSGNTCTIICELTENPDPEHPGPHTTTEVVFVGSFGECRRKCYEKQHSLDYCSCDMSYNGGPIHELCGAWD